MPINPLKTISNAVSDGAKAVSDGAKSVGDGVKAVGDGAKSVGGGVLKVTDASIQKVVRMEVKRDQIKHDDETNDKETDGTPPSLQEEEEKDDAKDDTNSNEITEEDITDQDQNLESSKPKPIQKEEEESTTTTKTEYVELHPTVQALLLFYPILIGFILSILTFHLTGGSFYSFVFVPAFLAAKVMQVALRFLLPFVGETDFMALYDHVLRWQDRLEKFMGTEASSSSSKEDGSKGDGSKEGQPHTLKGVVSGVGAALNPMNVVGGGGGDKKSHEKEA